MISWIRGYVVRYAPAGWALAVWGGCHGAPTGLRVIGGPPPAGTHVLPQPARWWPAGGGNLTSDQSGAPPGGRRTRNSPNGRRSYIAWAENPCRSMRLLRYLRNSGRHCSRCRSAPGTRLECDRRQVIRQPHQQHCVDHRGVAIRYPSSPPAKGMPAHGARDDELARIAPSTSDTTRLQENRRAACRRR